jgi:hypothetical protein
VSAAAATSAPLRNDGRCIVPLQGKPRPSRRIDASWKSGAWPEV